MLQPVPEQSEGKAMWLAEGRASLSEGRAAKSKLGMRFFQEQQGGSLFTEEQSSGDGSERRGGRGIKPPNPIR